MEELLEKLRKEKFEIYGKIRNLEKFRMTKEWNELSLNHKELLDIQLKIMQSYWEVLNARCLDLQQKIMKDEKEQNNKQIIEIEII